MLDPWLVIVRTYFWMASLGTAAGKPGIASYWKELALATIPSNRDAVPDSRVPMDGDPRWS